MSRYAHAPLRSARLVLGGILAGLTLFTATAHAAFSPTDVSGLALWLDANNIDGHDNGTLSSGGQVSTWTDLSGNGHDATQSTSAAQPTYTPGATPHGGAAVSFDSSNQQYLIDSAHISGPTTVFIIYNTEGTPSGFESPITLLNAPAGSYTTFDQINFQTGNVGYTNISIVADGPSGTTVGINPSFDSSSHLFAFGYNGGGPGSTSSYQISSDLTPQTVLGSSVTNIAASHDGAVGQRDGDTGYYSGNISAILVYSGDLGSTDFNNVQNYLNSEFLTAPEPASLGLIAVGGIMLLRGGGRDRWDRDIAKAGGPGKGHAQARGSGFQSTCIS